MKRLLSLLLLLFPLLALAQTNVQKGSGNVLSNGSVVVGSGTSITATGTGTIAATSIPTLSVNTTAPLTGGGALTGNLTLAIPAASGSVNGYLSSTDWATFNAKQPAGSYVLQSTTVSTTAPLSGGGALSSNLTLSIPAATSSVNGYLSSTDWATFNAKQPAGSYVLQSTTVNGHALSSNVTVTASDVGLGSADSPSFAAATASTGSFTTSATGQGLSLHGGGTVTGASGAVTVASASNGNIKLTPNGSGTVIVNSMTKGLAVGNVAAAGDASSCALLFNDGWAIRNVAGSAGTTYLDLGDTVIFRHNANATASVTINSTKAASLGAGALVVAGGVSGASLNISGASTLTGAVTSSNIAALTTIAESWVGPSSTTGVYFKGGNVGIGTTNPLHKLDVAGSISLGDYASGSGHFVGTRRTDGNFVTTGAYTNYLSYLEGGVDNHYSAGIDFGTNQYGVGGFTAMSIRAGNVGIGTAAITSGAKLEVSGTTSAVSSITGTLVVGNLTAATTVGIGDGNINAGGSITGASVTASTGDFNASTTGTGLAMHGGGKITGASGAVTVAASGTNQDVSVTPSGSGKTNLGGDVVAGPATTHALTTTKVGHLSGYGTCPTIAAGAGAGTSPTIGITGTDAAFRVTLTTGTSCSTGSALFVVTFNTAYASAPYVVFSRGAGGNPGTIAYVGTSATQVTLSTVAPTALSDSTAYSWGFIVIQ